ncbi:ER-golgi trafficking TRAPP I complex 85 kDa subunit-domain-containing protein [Pilobolus umbonatus]|nr:ER-golgi trafficking TRAPP I complex 85 kDa subunit-domain-containing protein [Pilobolus umbonatus]
MEKPARYKPAIQEYITSTVSPVIAVTSSEDAEELCRVNHIPSFADFIKPFGNMIESRITVRDWQGLPNALDNFSVRFKPIDKLDEPNHEAVMRLVQERVRENGEGPIEEIKDRNSISEAYLKTLVDDITPWYSKFKHTLLSLRGITEHETFDHPVAVMIVISSSNPDPISTIMQLYNPSSPTFSIDKPYVDTNILRYYVILHDPQRTTIEQSTAVFESLKRTFGLHCFLLKINSRKSEEDRSEDEIRAIWDGLAESTQMQSELQSIPATDTTAGHTRSSSISSYKPLPSYPFEKEEKEKKESIQVIEYGRYLTKSDVDQVKLMVKEFIVQSMLPFMERNIQHWNEQVASVRRGLTGRLFGAGRRLFGTTNRSPSPQSVQTISVQGPNVPVGSNTLTIYPFAAPEAQMRKLADFSFMLRDYKFALTIYDTVRRDYATEKAYKYHAGTQEMLGICQLMINQPLANKADVDRNFELAVQQYIGRCRSPFHATRTTLIYYELLKARKMWKDIPTALVRMTGEDSDLRSGLFLEQAAHSFLRINKPMVRKYGFHLVMAGHRYGKANQRIHAYRCYKMASFVLDDNQWSVAKNHIQFALGRQAYHLGRLEDAITYFSNVLTDTKQSPQQQLTHIKEFLFIYQNYTTQMNINPLKESFPNLSLPVIEDSGIQVTLSNVHSNTSHNEEWAEMELELLEENIARGYIASSKKAMAVKQQDDHRVVCAVGEPAIVHLELFNPLQISISLSQVILGCKYSESIDSRNTDVDSDELMPEGTQVEDSDMYMFDHYELQKYEDITLEAMEKRMVNLAIIPRHQGTIQITGVHYILNGLVHTFKVFHKKGKRLNKTKEEMMSVVYSDDRSLDLLVTSPMPLLDLTFHNVPETILSGEVVQTVLEINNKGNKGLRALRLKSSHPSFICVGNPEEMDKHIYEDNPNQSSNMQMNNQLFDSTVVSIPLPAKKGEEHSNENGVIIPGQATLVPLWIRGDRIGKHTMKFLFSYQSDEDNAIIAHRTLRYTVTVQVLPSLKISAFTRPSATAVNEYVLGIEIENLQTLANFDLTQLTAVSPVWEVMPLSIDMTSSEDVEAKTNLPPRQTTFAYYKIRKAVISDTSCPEAWTSNCLSNLLHKSDDNGSTSIPPPIQLNISQLSFRENSVPYDAVPLKTFALNSRMQWRQGNLETQFPNILHERYNDLFTLYNSGDIDITLYWDIPQLKRYGHHYIIGVNLGVQQNPFQGEINVANKGNTRTMFEATAKERMSLINNLTRHRSLKDESPIKLMVYAPDRVVHDFNQKGLLKVGIRISFRNCSWNKSCKYALDLLPWSDGKVSQKNSKSSINIYPFHWAGSTVLTGFLKPDEETTLEGYAHFQIAGVYDINRWKLTVRTDDNEDGDIYIHQPGLPHLVNVINAA